MKKNVMIIGLLFLFSILAIIPSSGSATTTKGIIKIPIWTGWQTNTSFNGVSVTVFVDYNPSTSSILSVTAQNAVTLASIGVVSYNGTISHTGGQMYASGFRVNLAGGGSDYVVLNGALNM